MARDPQYDAAAALANLPLPAATANTVTITVAQRDHLVTAIRRSIAMHERGAATKVWRDKKDHEAAAHALSVAVAPLGATQ